MERKLLTQGKMPLHRYTWLQTELERTARSSASLARPRRGKEIDWRERSDVTVHMVDANRCLSEAGLSLDVVRAGPQGEIQVNGGEIEATWQQEPTGKVLHIKVYEQTEGDSERRFSGQGRRLPPPPRELPPAK